MRPISDLNAEELTEHAFNIFLTQGRHIEASRVLYRVLELNPTSASALRCLSDFHAREGTEQFAAAALEYALSDACPKDEEQRRVLEDIRFLDIWSWGFSRHKSGSANLEGKAFEKREDFTVDSARYEDFLNDLVRRAGSLRGAVEGARVLCGLLGGFLKHESKANPDLVDALKPSSFSPTSAYAEWLSSSSESLDKLKARVADLKAEQSGGSKPWWKLW